MRQTVFECSERFSLTVTIDSNNKVLIMVGEIGSGKTTQFPSIYPYIIDLIFVECKFQKSVEFKFGPWTGDW